MEFHDIRMRSRIDRREFQLQIGIPRISEARWSTQGDNRKTEGKGDFSLNQTLKSTQESTLVLRIR